VWNNDAKKINTEAERRIMSEVIINNEGDNLITITLPQEYLKDEISVLQRTGAMAGYINISHPILCFKDVRKLPNDHLQNSTVTFYWGGGNS